MTKAINFINRGNLFCKLYLRRASPRQVLNILKATVFRFFSKIKYPLSVLIGLTDECQCSCVHCGIDKSQSNPPQQLLSFTEIRSFINELSRLGVVNITFAGGEPILRREIFEIIRVAFLKGLFTSLDSNGLLLDRENVRKLKKVGLTLVKISLDSSVAKIHDKNRGVEGCFEKALAAIKNCVSESIPCVVTTVVTNEVIRNRDLENIINLVKGAGASALQMEFLAYSGKLLNKEYDFLDEEGLKYAESVCDYRYVYYSSIFSDFLKCSCLSGLNCYVSPTGVVKICMFLPNKFGNIRNKDFKNLWEEMSRHPFYKFSSKDCYGQNSYFRSLLKMSQAHDY